MDNKSELSKPVAWTDERGNLCTNRNKERGLESRYRQDYEKYTTPFYSQEYVSALLAELERYKQYAKERDAENKSLALTAGRLRVELEAKDNRITELEAKTAMTMGVGSGNGNLFVHGDYDSIKAAQAIVLENESLRAKLATPVRLPGSFYPDGDIDLPLVVELDEAVEAIRAAGFTVERVE